MCVGDSRLRGNDMCIGECALGIPEYAGMTCEVGIFSFFFVDVILCVDKKLFGSHIHHPYRLYKAYNVAKYEKYCTAFFLTQSYFSSIA